ncbi:histidine ammonia-lyase [Rugamonas sp. FT82W]|uniref:Histidine ammonia-lyase n=1 Tax=Duganella vulcania TaxID=2692166 RepID=A0A845GD53_9BURK|nr:aromatic amino acid ammonia-lyase [Duganella vulcania]MYM91841.1 histidine ammonia-lyase [Duganella vulcania]
MSSNKTFVISDRHYSVQELFDAAAQATTLAVTDDVRRKIIAGHDYVKEVARSERIAYGVNTGFGSLCTTKVPQEQLSRLQHNHLLSHACGVGEIVPAQISRMVVLVKLLTFRGGHSGVGMEVVDRIMALWNRGVVGAIPRKGTVGASGDLAPLAHLALPLIGLGEVWADGHLRASAAVMEELGLAPLTLGPKEGLCLTNGVQYINSLGAHALVSARRLVKLADVCAAMSFQGFNAARSPFDPLVHTTTLHPERRQVAANLAFCTEGGDHYAQQHSNPAAEDPYSFRCSPQVHGAVRQTVDFAVGLIEKECNSVSDNPLVFADERQILTAGNLHGESTAFALDFSAIALSELSNISERRTYQLLSGQNGVPPFLIADAGVNSGFMVVQYTSAALVNENKVLSTPASIDTIPTCHLQEDHVSMGGTSAYKLATIIENCHTVLAIELLCAAQAIDLNPQLTLSPVARRLHTAFRKVVPYVAQDVLMHELIKNAEDFIRRSDVLDELLDQLQ